MVVYCHCEGLLGSLLPDDIVAELFINLLGCWYLACMQTRLRDGSLLLFDDLSTEVDAFITNVDTSRTSDESLYLVLTLATARATVSSSHIFRICHVCHLSLKELQQ